MTQQIYAGAPLKTQLKYFGGITLALIGIGTTAYLLRGPEAPRIMRTTQIVPVVEYATSTPDTAQTMFMDERSSAFIMREDKAILRDPVTAKEYAFDLERVIESLNPSDKHGQPYELMVRVGKTCLVPDFDGDGQIRGLPRKRVGSITFVGTYNHTSRQLLEQHWTIQR
ncbi:TPA: hypothetical protein HA251_02540 [Candidatus Woesearchaeota archaeon]|nr:hypothetical protein [Candidatus Woesearchaeota archaeon]